MGRSSNPAFEMCFITECRRLGLLILCNWNGEEEVGRKMGANHQKRQEAPNLEIRSQMIWPTELSYHSYLISQDVGIKWMASCDREPLVVTSRGPSRGSPGTSPGAGLLSPQAQSRWQLPSCTTTWLYCKSGSVLYPSIKEILKNCDFFWQAASRAHWTWSQDETMESHFSDFLWAEHSCSHLPCSCSYGEAQTSRGHSLVPSV